MDTIQRWTGREARLLREALRMSVSAFAAYLDIGDGTISKSRALLDTGAAGVTCLKWWRSST